MGKKSKTAVAPPKDGGMDIDSPPKGAPAAKGSKRRARDRGDEQDDDDNEDGPLGDDEDVEMLDVNFSFFDPQPQDYHSIKLLLSQLLGHVDAATGDLDLAGVTDLVLEQKLVGSTVKTDSGEDDDKANEGDPYAVLTVLNLNVHKDKPAISSLIKYLLSKLDSPASSAFHAQLSALLQNPVGEEAEAKKQQQHVGLVLSERMVNMPTQIVPPMYRMLQEELQWAVEDKEPYNFSHLLFLSRVFLSSTAALEDDPNAALEQAIVAEAGLRSSQVAAPKKKKQRKGATKDERDDEKIWMYHPEDEFIQKFAEHKHVYNYTRSRRQGQDGAGDDFGVEQRGQLMLVPWAKFAEVVAGMEDFVGAAVA